MRFITAVDRERLEKKLAMMIAAQVTRKPDSVLGLATGSSPMNVYKRLVELYRQGYVDFSEASSVNLDEYTGLHPSDPQSYSSYMNQHLFQHINIQLERTHIPSSDSACMEAECARYEALIQRLGGIDMQLLGIGRNGHIGFNEPSATFPVATHVVHLDESTIRSNAQYFESAEAMPRQAITVGIGTIMQARKVVLMAFGEQKADILQQAFFGQVTPEVPASILQFHPDVTIVADQAAMQTIVRNSKDHKDIEDIVTV
ncbi:glucosamine-6-phosphate deaminase [Marinicrinis sediminis]|uniref:Glucosamine-6-phosphate deaminase n=1 Tax=Marinicrinis sediminis TaxID=1652465 RepID=A0ABW5RFA7_9BACL